MFELQVGQRLVIVEQGNLIVEVGVVLGRGPDQVQQVVRGDRQDALAVDPFADLRFLEFGPVIEGFTQLVAEDRCVLHHLAGPNLGAVGAGARVVHLGADIGGEHHARVVVELEAQRVLLPHVEQVEEYGAVQVFLGLEVVVQVGLGQFDQLGDVLHGGAGEAAFGEDLFGGEENLFGVLQTDAELAVGHRDSMLRE